MTISGTLVPVGGGTTFCSRGASGSGCVDERDDGRASGSGCVDERDDGRASGSGCVDERDDGRGSSARWTMFVGLWRGISPKSPNGL